MSRLIDRQISGLKAQLDEARADLRLVKKQAARSGDTSSMRAKVKRAHKAVGTLASKIQELDYYKGMSVRTNPKRKRNPEPAMIWAGPDQTWEIRVWSMGPNDMTAKPETSYSAKFPADYADGTGAEWQKTAQGWRLKYEDGNYTHLIEARLIQKHKSKWGLNPKRNPKWPPRACPYCGVMVKFGYPDGDPEDGPAGYYCTKNSCRAKEHQADLDARTPEEVAWDDELEAKLDAMYGKQEDEGRLKNPKRKKRRSSMLTRQQKARKLEKNPSSTILSKAKAAALRTEYVLDKYLGETDDYTSAKSKKMQAAYAAATARVAKLSRRS